MTTFYSFAFRNGKLEKSSTCESDVTKSTRRSYQKEASSESFDQYTAILPQEQLGQKKKKGNQKNTEKAVAKSAREAAKRGNEREEDASSGPEKR